MKTIEIPIKTHSSSNYPMQRKMKKGMRSKGRGGTLGMAEKRFRAPMMKWGAAPSSSNSSLATRKFDKMGSKRKSKATKMAPISSLASKPKAMFQDEVDDVFGGVDMDQWMDMMDLEEESSIKTKSVSGLKSKPQAKQQLAGYENIIQYQEPDGHFSSVPSKYEELASTPIPEDLSTLIEEASEATLAWNTILWLFLLEKHFKKCMAEWKMIAKKAKTYLKKNFKIDYQKYKSVIE